MDRLYPDYSILHFRTNLSASLSALAFECDTTRFVTPVGLFLMIDAAHGGDATAQEIQRRFKVIHCESRDTIDFHFFGWGVGRDDTPKFDVRAFDDCRRALEEVGIKAFGGNADLVLVDAWFDSGYVELDFASALHFDIAKLVADGHVSTVGSFLQQIIEASRAIREEEQALCESGAVIRISSTLGLAAARRSLLDYFLDKLAKPVGGIGLKTYAVKRLGPRMPLSDLNWISYDMRAMLNE